MASELIPKEIEEQRLALRRRAQTDLFWLAKNVLGYKEMIERVHKPICDLFVQKDPNKPIAEQDEIKLRLLLFPRGHFKSSVDIADIVQWVLCFPNIRIALVTGSLNLAERFMFEIQSHFLRNDTLRALFPEHCPDPDDRSYFNSQAFTTPARTQHNLREPTISVTTAGSVKAGSHYDVIKIDDMVHENNVGTLDQIQKTIQEFNYITPLLEPYGYRDVIGTIYHHSDLHCWLLEQGTDNMKFLKKACWEVKPDGTKELLFPERFTLKFLEERQREDPYIFSCQYLLNPIVESQQLFTKEQVASHFVAPNTIPYGPNYIAWDLASSVNNSNRSYSVGAVGRFVENKLYILEIIRGQFNPHELVEKILLSAYLWRPRVVAIEKSPGAQFLMPALESKSQQLQIPVPNIRWIKLTPDKSKYERVSALQPLLANDRLFFSTAISDKDQLITELTRFPAYRHNDIPDAISLLLNVFPTGIAYVPEESGTLPVPVVTGDGMLGAGLIG